MSINTTFLNTGTKKRKKGIVTFVTFSYLVTMISDSITPQDTTGILFSICLLWLQDIFGTTRNFFSLDTGLCFGLISQVTQSSTLHTNSLTGGTGPHSTLPEKTKGKI